MQERDKLYIGGEWVAPARCDTISVVDSTTDSFVFEMTGSTEKLNAFIQLMDPLGLVEVSRTGTVAIARGPARF